MLSFGIEGYFRGHLAALARWCFVGAGLLFIFPSWLAIGGAEVLAIEAWMMTPHLRGGLKPAI